MSKKTTAPAAARSAAPAAVAPVDQNQVNRSELIRKYHADNPNAKPSEIAKALTEKGHEVSSSLVSSVLGDRRKKSGGMNVETIKSAATFVKSYKGKVAEAAAAIEAVGQFIDACGGSEQAMEALTAFQELSDAIG